jgi:hypothetical protein
MADEKKFLDQIGVGYLWSKIKGELNKKANVSNLNSLEDRVETLETSQFVIYGGSAFDVMKEDE